MMLKLANLTYGRQVYPVRADEALPLPAQFDFDRPEECAKLVLAIMSNAGGGHTLSGCRVAINATRKTANITGSGAHVYYAPTDEKKVTSPAELQAMMAERVVIELGNVVTDQYGGGWRRAVWAKPRTAMVAA